MSRVRSPAETIAAVERAVDVLSLFAQVDEPTLGVTEIAQSLGLSKAVVYRILSSFRTKGLVVIDPATRRYALGPRVMHLGLAYMNRLDVRAIARPELERLSARMNETATLSIRDGWTRVYIDQVTPARDVKMVVQLGRNFPLHAGASSKAFLAFLRPDERDEYLSGKLDKLTPSTITSVRALRRELAEIRRRGYASSVAERMEGAASVAAPVLGHDGCPVAVVSVSGPAERFVARADEAAAELRRSVGELSRQLGA
jgi:DNA-binding IclR family transcriptional regulator